MTGLCCRFCCRFDPPLSGIPKGAGRQITRSATVYDFLSDFSAPLGLADKREVGGSVHGPDADIKQRPINSRDVLYSLHRE
jgi:hypothetical protein